MPYTMKSRGTPKMQRAHFEAIAAVLKAHQPSPALGAYHKGQADQWALTARAMADTLASTNPNFRRADFLSACGIEE